MSKEYDGYLPDQSHKKLDLCGFCGQPRQKVCRECFEITYKEVVNHRERIETLIVRFNELCRMLSVQLANSSFSILTIQEEDEEEHRKKVLKSLRKSGDLN